MARFEITNYGRKLHFPYGKDEVFLDRNRTELTDDAELAAMAEKFSYVGVVENKPGILEMNKKELVEEAIRLGITNATNKRKAQLQEEIVGSPTAMR